MTKQKVETRTEESAAETVTPEGVSKASVAPPPSPNEDGPSSEKVTDAAARRSVGEYLDERQTAAARVQFATAAMAGLLANPNMVSQSHFDGEFAKVAETAWKIADAMISAAPQ